MIYTTLNIYGSSSSLPCFHPLFLYFYWEKLQVSSIHSNFGHDYDRYNLIYIFSHLNSNYWLNWNIYSHIKIYPIFYTSLHFIDINYYIHLFFSLYIHFTFGLTSVLKYQCILFFYLSPTDKLLLYLVVGWWYVTTTKNKKYTLYKLIK